MDRIEQARRIGALMLVLPLLTVAILGVAAKAVVVLAVACSLVGLGVILWAQMVQDGQERIERDYR